jgi:hypothetical protein
MPTNSTIAVFCAVDKHFTRRVFRARYVVWYPSAQLSGVACELEHQGYGCVHVAVQYCILVHWHGRLLLVHSKVWRIFVFRYCSSVGTFQYCLQYFEVDS